MQHALALIAGNPMKVIVSCDCLADNSKTRFLLLHESSKISKHSESSRRRNKQKLYDIFPRRQRSRRFPRNLPGISLSRDTGTNTRVHHFLDICLCTEATLHGVFGSRYCFRLFGLNSTAWCLGSRTFTVEGLPVLRFCRNSSSTLRHRYTGRISTCDCASIALTAIGVRRIGCESAFRA